LKNKIEVHILHIKKRLPGKPLIPLEAVMSWAYTYYYS